MSTETASPPTPKIPEPVVEEKVLTYESPNVLLPSVNGVIQMRESRNVQIPHTMTRSFGKEKVSKAEFLHRATSRFRAGGHTMNVICDTATYNGQRLNASSPTATDYMAAIGTVVTLQHKCTRVPPHLALRHYGTNEELWMSEEMTITLPEFKDNE